MTKRTEEGMDRRADSTWDYSLSTCLGAHGGGEDLTKPFFPWVWKERRGESGETAKKKRKEKGGWERKGMEGEERKM